jgi:DNA polymerase III psi subunit
MVVLWEHVLGITKWTTRDGKRLQQAMLRHRVTGDIRWVTVAEVRRTADDDNGIPAKKEMGQ